MATNLEILEASGDAGVALQLGENIAAAISDALNVLAANMDHRVLWLGLASGVGQSAGAVLAQLKAEEPRINERAVLGEFFKFARQAAEFILNDKELRASLVADGKAAASKLAASGNN